MRECLSAFTRAEGYRYYPPYISIVQNDEGLIEVHVRSEESETHPGQSALIVLTPKDFVQVAGAAIAQLLD